jgi:hypothetical protein
MKHYTFTFKARFTERDIMRDMPEHEGTATIGVSVCATSLEDAIHLLGEKLSVPFDTGDDE